MSKSINFPSGRPKLSKSGVNFNSRILNAEERRFTRTSLHLSNNNRNRKFSNPEQFYSTMSTDISETHASFQPQIKPRPKDGYPNTTSSNLSRRKQVTFKDQQERVREPTTPHFMDSIHRNNRNVVVNAVSTHPPILKRKDSEKQLMYVVQGISSIETPHSKAPAFNQFASPSELRPSPSETLFTIDMAGFHSQNIAFYIKGRRLIVEGTRPIKHPFISSRRTQEIIELPQGVHGDNLRIARDSNGTLLFEEAWKF